eukprot:GHRQ01016844.1.p1 GENE.GHRQ01016844.1~~GHRQ01016844.1.p1  ORF type:complete len:114 (-),score=31.08 GHRQ01016844.1:414-755(-)
MVRNAPTMVRSQDETILPSDFKRAGVIVDDDLNAMLVRPLAPGVTLHALVDACHSGTAMDLPYRAKVASDGRFSWKVIAPAWLTGVAMLVLCSWWAAELLPCRCTPQLRLRRL